MFVKRGTPEPHAASAVADPQATVPAWTIVRTDTFTAWLDGMKNLAARAIIVRRIERLRRGLRGDAKSVGGGVTELRIDVGPGYRVYFTERSGTIVILLCGGDKGSQPRDIATAQALAADI